MSRQALDVRSVEPRPLPPITDRLPSVRLDPKERLPVLQEWEARKTVHQLVAVLLCLGGALILGILFTPWQQTVPGFGRVVALAPVERPQTIDAPIEGRIVRWHVMEGTRVKAGDLVCEISDNDPRLLERLQLERDAVASRLAAARLRAAEMAARISELEAALRADIDSAEARVRQADDRLRAAEQSVEAARAAQLAAQQNLDRTRLLFPKGLRSKRDLELAEADATRTEAEVRRAEAALSEARNARLAALAERDRVQRDRAAALKDARAAQAVAAAEVASSTQALTQTEVRLARQQTQMVTAPRDGRILRLLAQPGGEILKPGDPVAAFVPDPGRRVAELWIHGNDLPLVSVGRLARLQFEGWPAVQFVGWPSVAVGTFGGRVLLIDATDNGQGNFRLLVEPDPHDQPWPDERFLRQGVRAKGWIMLNSVPLWFEVWRRLNGFPPVLTFENRDTFGKSLPRTEDQKK